MASPLSSTLSGSILRDNSLSESPHTPGHTPSPRKLKRLQSANSTDELHSDSKCKRCGWRYPTPNPHYRQRRDHKKICPNRSPFGSAEDIGRSGDYGDLARSQSGDSGLTGDHDLTDTAKSSRKALSFGELDQEKPTKRQETQKQTERAVNNKLEHGLGDEPDSPRDKFKAGSSEGPDSATKRQETQKQTEREVNNDLEHGLSDEQDSPGDKFKAGSSEEPDSATKRQETQKQTEGEVNNELEQGLSGEPDSAGDKFKAGSSEEPDSAGDKFKVGSSEEPDSAGNEFKVGSSEEPDSAGDKFKAGSSEEHEVAGDNFKVESSSVPIDSEEKSDGTGNGKAEVFQGKELDLQPVPEHLHQDTHSPRFEYGLETGSDSEVSSAAGEHETDHSDDMGFESSDIGEVGKREESYPSDDDIPQEERKDGTLQHEHPYAHTQIKAGLEGTHDEEGRTDSEGEGKPINVANLITKYEKRSPTSLPSDVTSDHKTLTGNKRSLPFVKTGETEQLSLRSKDHRNVGEITPAEEILEGGLSTASGGDYDLEYILKKQKTHDLICPICGSQITNRIVLRKKRRTFVSKDESRLPEITADASNQDQDVKALPASTGSHGETWFQKCLGYLGLFRNDN